jgi:hypothetical protein
MRKDPNNGTSLVHLVILDSGSSGGETSGIL